MVHARKPVIDKPELNTERVFLQKKIMVNHPKRVLNDSHFPLHLFGGVCGKDSNLFLCLAQVNQSVNVPSDKDGDKDREDADKQTGIIDIEGVVSEQRHDESDGADKQGRNGRPMRFEEFNHKEYFY